MDKISANDYQWRALFIGNFNIAKDGLYISKLLLLERSKRGFDIVETPYIKIVIYKMALLYSISSSQEKFKLIAERMEK